MELQTEMKNFSGVQGNFHGINVEHVKFEIPMTQVAGCMSAIYKRENLWR